MKFLQVQFLPLVGVVHFVFSCFFTVLTAVLSGACAAAPEKPDIVIFLTDDHSQLDAEPYGANTLRTPNMQRLADAGLTFTRAYVASPSCAPSRAALLTGLMPARNGAEANHSKPHRGVKKWPAYFQALGYEVAAFGKVAHYKHTGDYGFDFFAYDTFHDHAGIPAAVEFLKRRNRSKPLCLFVGSNWPHVPWPASAPGYDAKELPLPAGSVDTPETREWRARYAAAVSKADDDLGLIMEAAESSLGKQTLFLMTSDHGAQWPFGKWNCYEAGVCVPLIVAWPGVVKEGQRTHAMVSWVDLLPTLLEAGGGVAPEEIDGRSFLPVIRGKKTEHRSRIFTMHSNDGRKNIYPIRSLREGNWKYIRNLHPEFAYTTHIDLGGELAERAYFKTWVATAQKDPAAAAIFHRYRVRPAEELYDLLNDPHEQRNLAGEVAHQEKLKSLRTELDEWMRDQGDQQSVLAKPRLLINPASYEPAASESAERTPGKEAQE